MFDPLKRVHLTVKRTCTAKSRYHPNLGNILLFLQLLQIIILFLEFVSQLLIDHTVWCRFLWVIQRGPLLYEQRILSIKTIKLSLGVWFLDNNVWRILSHGVIIISDFGGGNHCWRSFFELRWVIHMSQRSHWNVVRDWLEVLGWWDLG